MKNTIKLLIPAVLLSPMTFGAGLPTRDLEEVIITTHRAELLGEVRSASEGVVTSLQLQTRPVLRTGELLETVPGLVVTQHSGDGKANQFFLRGFNLDHGTDLATRVDGVPVNMPTHAHGQGYTDLGFVIPELVENIEYRKGTYYADEGNFSAAGAVDLIYSRDLGAGLAVFERGADSFTRAMAAVSPELGGGTVLLAGEYSQTDGPWQLDENLRKGNGVIKYSRGDRRDGFSITATAYRGSWTSTDQIPQRAVDAGQLDRLGFVDPSDGGESHRRSLSADWRHQSGPWSLQARAYGVDYDLDLYSNFTYFTDEENGDQFEQLDDRRVYGGEAVAARDVQLGSKQARVRMGVELRHDDIDTVGLYKTLARERLATIREDAVRQTAWSAFVEQQIELSQWLRASAGVRYDRHDFDVRSDLAANSGEAADDIVSPKLTLIAGPWAKTELFLNLGRGFHANDARGTTITVDPTDGLTPADRVSPLVAARGGEIGARTAILPRTQLAASFWMLELDSELLYVGDAGFTAASRATRRRGIEIAAYINPVAWLTIDADLAWSHARFSDFDPAGQDIGNRIPNAIERVASMGVAVDHPRGWFAGARLRHFGAAPLIEDGSVHSKPTTVVNLKAGYRFTNGISASLAGFNLLDSNDNDITYFYESRLAGEASAVADIHFHPIEPRTVRLILEAQW